MALQNGKASSWMKGSPDLALFFPLSTVSRAPPSFCFFVSLSFSNSPSLSLTSCDRHQGDVTSVFGCDGRTTKPLWKSIKGGRKRATRVLRRQMSDMDRVEGGTSCRCAADKAARHSSLDATASPSTAAVGHSSMKKVAFKSPVCDRHLLAGNGV